MSWCVFLFVCGFCMCSNGYRSCTALVCMSVSNSKDIWRLAVCPLVAPKNVSLPAALFDKAGNVRMQHGGASVQPLLPGKSNEYYAAWVCVFVTLGFQHAMRKRHIVVCGLPRCTIYFHISHKLHSFRKKKVTGHKMRVLIFSTTLVWNISHSKKIREIW